MSSELVYGIHAVSRRLQQAPEHCIELICADKSNQRLLDLIELANKAGISVNLVPRAALTEICDTTKHQGCVLKTRPSMPQLSFAQCLERINQQSLILVLDGVQDPHNLGACLRSADACGVDAVIIPRQRAAKLSPTVRKVAAGAAESVPLIEVANIARSLGELKQAGVWIFGSSGDATASLYAQDFKSAVALVMGGEGSGLRRLTQESCDHLIKIPMRGQVESLNVSVATGVCLYEIMRSRSACGPA